MSTRRLHGEYPIYFFGTRCASGVLRNQMRLASTSHHDHLLLTLAEVRWQIEAPHR